LIVPFRLPAIPLLEFNQKPSGWFLTRGWNVNRSPGVLADDTKGLEFVMSDFRDNQNGVNDPVDGVDVKRRFNDNQTPHERAQKAADVRANASPAADEEFLPEALRRRPTDPLNKRTGRNPAD
jgi:hypothetical protein